MTTRKYSLACELLLSITRRYFEPSRSIIEAEGQRSSLRCPSHSQGSALQGNEKKAEARQWDATL